MTFALVNTGTGQFHGFFGLRRDMSPADALKLIRDRYDVPDADRAIAVPKSMHTDWIARLGPNGLELYWDVQAQALKERPQKQIDASRMERRLSLLAATDWTQISDNDLSPGMVLAWAKYRQALRDYPETLDWPEPPDGPAEVPEPEPEAADVPHRLAQEMRDGETVAEAERRLSDELETLTQLVHGGGADEVQILRHEALMGLEFVAVGRSAK